MQKRRYFLAVLALAISVGTASAVVPASPLVPLPTSVALTFTKPSTAGAAVPVTLTPPLSAGTVFYMVDQSTVPAWLTLSKASDTATSTSA